MNERFWRGKFKFCANLVTFLKELIEITFDLEVKSMYISKGIVYYCMNEKIVDKYLKLCATVESILLKFYDFVYGRIWVSSCALFT